MPFPEQSQDPASLPGGLGSSASNLGSQVLRRIFCYSGEGVTGRFPLHFLWHCTRLGAKIVTGAQGSAGECVWDAEANAPVLTAPVQSTSQISSSAQGAESLYSPSQPKLLVLLLPFPSPSLFLSFFPLPFLSILPSLAPSLPPFFSAPSPPTLTSEPLLMFCLLDSMSPRVLRLLEMDPPFQVLS